MKQNGFTLIELMIVIAILGVLLSLAVPAYQDHIVRTKVIEGLNLASSAKIAVSESVMTNHRLPQSQTETGYTSPLPTKNVKSVTIGKNGTISINYTQQAGNGTLILTPSIQTSGELTWSCTEGSLPTKYRPANCRTS